MHVLKHFEFFRIEMTQQTTTFDIQTVAHQVTGSRGGSPCPIPRPSDS
jgi:hypothetical protein